jgi:hypothetical protein
MGMGTEWDSWGSSGRPSDTYSDWPSLKTLAEETSEEEERRRIESFRRSLEAFERWNMLPEWKRIWFGEKTKRELDRLDDMIALAEEIPELKKAIKLAQSAETAKGIYKKGFLAFFGGILILGPGIKMLKEMWDWFISLRVGPP